MTTRWDAARYRQRQPVRKYKPVGPVGDRDKNCVSGVLAGKYEVLQFGEIRNVSFAGPEHEWRNVEPEACSDCGYHVCSCPPKRLYMGMDLGVAESESRTIVYETVAGKLTIVVDPKHVGPPRFVYPHSATCSCIDCAERRGS